MRVVKVVFIVFCSRAKYLRVLIILSVSGLNSIQFKLILYVVTNHPDDFDASSRHFICKVFKIGNAGNLDVNFRIVMHFR